MKTEQVAIEWAEERFETLRERAMKLDVAYLQYRGEQTQVTSSPQNVGRYQLGTSFYVDNPTTGRKLK